MQDLSASIEAGGAALDWEVFDLARLLGDVEAADDDDDLEISSLGRKRGLTLGEALRRQRETERHLTTPP